jgi:NAD(P)-dependent dehydrogenase (short-subunit alcohol dehydrogenase family)
MSNPKTGNPRLRGKVAVVTGGAQGIGASYVRALAAQGANVVIGDLVDADAVVRDVESLGAKAIATLADVVDPSSVRAMVDLAAGEFGRLDILVNNAAIFTSLRFKPFAEIDSSEWDRVMAVNVRGVFECVKAATPHMARNGYGKIVNIASGTVFKGAPMLLHYVTSKGAVLAMTRSLARELGDAGIRVNTIAPGLIMTDNVVANPSYRGAVVDGNVASRAIKRAATPEDLVGTLVYLCSPESDFVTGQCLVVDGGSVMH